MLSIQSNMLEASNKESEGSKLKSRHFQQLSYEKKQKKTLVTFHYTGCLVAIPSWEIINPMIMGKGSIIPYIPSTTSAFFRCSIIIFVILYRFPMTRPNLEISQQWCELRTIDLVALTEVPLKTSKSCVVTTYQCLQDGFSLDKSKWSKCFTVYMWRSYSICS